MDPNASTSSSTSTSSSESSSCPSLLDKLRAPRPSDLGRKRSIHANPPPVGKKRSLYGAAAGKHDPKGVSPSQRAKEFPGEHLTVSAGKLFCRACRECLVIKRSVVVSHVKCTKHLEGKKKLLEKEGRERDLAQSLRAHDAQTHHKGETLPDEQNVYRVKVVMAFMQAGIPLAKLDCHGLRDLLQENGYRLSDTRHMFDLVPFVLQEERSRLRAEIHGKCVSVIFDGTTRLGEVLAVVVRFVSDWNIQQRLVRLKFLMKSMCGEELARELISVLSVTLGVESHRLLAVMRDRASVNTAAMRVVAVMYPKLLDIGCLSHTLDLVGGRFKAPTLSLFTTLWVSLFAHSAKVKALWKEMTGRAMPTYSKTRWWSKWEIMRQILVQFGDVQAFLQQNEDISPATRPKLLEVLNDPRQLIVLKMELASVVDVGVHFVKATYDLEGDGVLVLNCYEQILKIRAAIQTGYYPNVQAIARQEFPGNIALQQRWNTYSIGCVQPGLDYFQDKLGNDTQNPMAAFKAARLFCPSKVNEMKPSAGDVDDLRAFPFLEGDIDGLKAELPTYLALAADVDASVDSLEWWKSHCESDGLAHWLSVAQKLFLVQPSSAAGERVFSILNRSFGDQQHNSLEDYVEATVMSQFNKR